jgi:hypothetical protein
MRITHVKLEHVTAKCVKSLVQLEDLIATVDEAVMRDGQSGMWRQCGIWSKGVTARPVDD